MPPTSRFFSSLRATSPFPRLRVTLTHGLRAVFGSPALLLVPLVLTLPIWLALLAAGLDHVPIGMTDLLALPPIGSLFDVNFIGEIFGVSSASLGVLGIVLLARALMWSVLVGMTVESVETGRVTLVGVVRGLLAFPTILVVIIVNAGLAFFASPLSRFVGLLALYAVVIGGLYFLVFASVAAVRGRPRAADALKLSARAGRLPGSRHLGMVFLYFFIAFFLGFNPALQPGPAFTANPSFGEWVLVLVATLVHMVFLAGFAYRYIEVEGVIPEGPSPRQARLAGARARRR